MLIEKEMGFIYFKENKIPRCCNKYLLEKRKQNVIHNMITAQYTLDVRSGNLRSNLSWLQISKNVNKFRAEILKKIVGFFGAISDFLTFSTHCTDA